MLLESARALQPYINDWREDEIEKRRAIVLLQADLEEALSGLAWCPCSLGWQPRWAAPNRVRRGEVMWIMEAVKDLLGSKWQIHHWRSHVHHLIEKARHHAAGGERDRKAWGGGLGVGINISHLFFIVLFNQKKEEKCKWCRVGYRARLCVQ